MIVVGRTGTLQFGPSIRAAQGVGRLGQTACIGTGFWPITYELESVELRVGSGLTRAKTEEGPREYWRVSSVRYHSRGGRCVMHDVIPRSIKACI